jgi:hypothetical protein
MTLIVGRSVADAPVAAPLVRSTPDGRAALSQRHELQARPLLRRRRPRRSRSSVHGLGRVTRRRQKLPQRRQPGRRDPEHRRPRAWCRGASAVARERRDGQRCCGARRKAARRPPLAPSRWPRGRPEQAGSAGRGRPADGGSISSMVRQMAALAVRAASVCTSARRYFVAISRRRPPSRAICSVVRRTGAVTLRLRWCRRHDPRPRRPRRLGGPTTRTAPGGRAASAEGPAAACP